MITICSGCKTRYQLDDKKVPRRLIRVRCPSCKTVFQLDGTQAGKEKTEPKTGLVLDRAQDRLSLSPPGGQTSRKGRGLFSTPKLTEPAAKVSKIPAEEPVPVTGAGVVDVPRSDSVSKAGSLPEIKSGVSLGTSTAEPSPVPAEPITETTAKPKTKPMAIPLAKKKADTEEFSGGPAPKSPRRKRDKTQMLARALVSDILVYNRETRDKALQEGNLIEALGQEIKKSWEMYKDRVSPEVANSTNHFKDALNEILAEGKKIF